MVVRLKSRVQWRSAAQCHLQLCYTMYVVHTTQTQMLLHWMFEMEHILTGIASLVGQGIGLSAQCSCPASGNVTYLIATVG
jgi:hypothetical protein